MATIAYDRPVRDFIAALDATGHVSHTQHRKSKVTLHHNGGRLSHEGVLSVWQVRPASAHFNIDAVGSVAQFVRLAEFAWATGSTLGNQESISFEMCNETIGPEWKVSDATWKSAARLTGWIHARVFGWRPTRDSVVVHHYWSATLCAGPYIDKMYEHILWLAQQCYDVFAAGGTPGEGDDVGFDQRLRNADGYEDTAANFLTAAENKANKLVSPIPVFGQDRNTTLLAEVSYLPFNFEQLNKKLDAQTAAITFLAQKVAENGGSSAEELEAAVARAIQANALRVDIHVQERHEQAVLAATSEQTALNPGSDGLAVEGTVN